MKNESGIEEVGMGWEGRKGVGGLFFYLRSLRSFETERDREREIGKNYVFNKKARL